MPVVARETPTTRWSAAHAGKLDERVRVAHRVVERDGFTRRDAAEGNERVGVGKTTVGVATVVDEVHFAEMVALGVEKSICANLQELMLLFGRELEGFTGGNFHSAPDRDRFSRHDGSLSDHVPAERRVVKNT